MSEAPVLVLNAGSSSLKYQLVVPETAEVQAKGIVERIGEAGSAVADHTAAMQTVEDDLANTGVDLDTVGLRAVGHRVVHGGPDFSDPTIIDDNVLEEIKDLIESRWRDDQIASRLRAMATEMLEKLKSGASFADVAAAAGLNLEKRTDIKRGSASSPLSTSQLVMEKFWLASMLMPSLCGATWLSIFTFSTLTPLHWK